MTQESRLIFLFALAILALAFIILGVILRHHWQTYSPNQILGRLLQILYWVIGATLLAVMAIAYVISFV